MSVVQARIDLALAMAKGAGGRLTDSSVGLPALDLAYALQDELDINPHYVWGAGPELADLFRGYKPRKDGTGTGEGYGVAHSYFDSYGWIQHENSAEAMVAYFLSRAMFLFERQHNKEQALVQAQVQVAG